GRVAGVVDDGGEGAAVNCIDAGDGDCVVGGCVGVEAADAEPTAGSVAKWAARSALTPTLRPARMLPKRQHAGSLKRAGGPLAAQRERGFGPLVIEVVAVGGHRAAAEA